MAYIEPNYIGPSHKVSERTMELRWMHGSLQQKCKVEEYFSETKNVKYYDEWIAVPNIDIVAKPEEIDTKNEPASGWPGRTILDVERVNKLQGAYVNACNNTKLGNVDIWWAVYDKAKEIFGENK